MKGGFMVRIGRWVDVKMQKLLSSVELSQRWTDLREAKGIENWHHHSQLPIKAYYRFSTHSKWLKTIPNYTPLAVDLSGFRLEAQISLTQNTRRPNTQLMRYILILPFYSTHLKTLHIWLAPKTPDIKKLFNCTHCNFLPSLTYNNTTSQNISPS